MINDVNKSINEIVEIINNQNLLEAFPNTNFTEILPNLLMTEEGYPNIDYTKFIIDEYYMENNSEKNFEEIFTDIFNNSSYLNLLKVIYTLSELEMSPNVDEHFKEILLNMKNG